LRAALGRHDITDLGQQAAKNENGLPLMHRSNSVEYFPIGKTR